MSAMSAISVLGFLKGPDLAKSWNDWEVYAVQPVYKGNPREPKNVAFEQLPFLYKVKIICTIH
jgi:hypothetical protein